MTVAQKKIIEEHKERRKKLNAVYDPIKGIGSLIKRFSWEIDTGITIYLPLEMKFDPFFLLLKENGWEKTADILESRKKNSKERLSEDEVRKMFHVIRCKYDFEYWCATCVIIENRMKEEVNFILSSSQRISLFDLEEMRTGNKPVRQIELKHRQYGSTTMKNAYAFWVQNVVYGGYSAYICSLDSSGGTKIVARYELIVKRYPEIMGDIVFKRYMGLKNTYQVVGANSLINVGSAENPNAPSGDTIQVALISEAGKMKSTTAKGANKLITNIMSMVELKPHTFVMVESTAEQSGSWFRNEVFRAKRKESGFRLTFINWITDTQCQIMLDASEYIDFIESMTEDEWELWGHGASLDQIKWYREKAREYQNLWQMQQENPTTIEEAFAGAGKKRFSPTVINNTRKTVCEPKYVGEVVGKADVGPESLEDVTFVANSKGELKIWIDPKDFPTEFPVAGRFAIYVDIGGASENSDYSVIKVVDRASMLEGGVPECAAEWRGHCDPTVLAWKAAQIAMYYTIDFDYPLLAVEYNALNARGNNTDGVHYLTIFNEIGNYYPNLFKRKSVDKVRNKTITHYGFYLTYASKTMIINSLHKAWEHGGYIEHNEVTVDEASFFEIKEDNTIGAIEGEHDDSLVATAGANWLASDFMEPPTYIKKQEIKKSEQYNEAMV